MTFHLEKYFLAYSTTSENKISRRETASLMKANPAPLPPPSTILRPSQDGGPKCPAVDGWEHCSLPTLVRHSTISEHPDGENSRVKLPSPAKTLHSSKTHNGCVLVVCQAPRSTAGYRSTGLHSNTQSAPPAFHPHSSQGAPETS